MQTSLYLPVGACVQQFFLIGMGLPHPDPLSGMAGTHLGVSEVLWLCHLGHNAQQQRRKERGQKT